MRPRRSRPNGSVDGGSAIAPVELDRLRDALDRELALALDAVVLEAAQVGRLEGDLRVPLGVEEVRRLQVAVQLLVLDVDARDLGRALEAAVAA